MSKCNVLDFKMQMFYDEYMIFFDENKKWIPFEYPFHIEIVYTNSHLTSFPEFLQRFGVYEQLNFRTVFQPQNYHT